MKVNSYLFFLLIMCTACNNKQASTTLVEKHAIEPTAAVSMDHTNSSKKSMVANTMNQQEDWYWKNTQMSHNDVFKNWEHGQVDLVMTYRYKQNADSPEILKVGTIDANGKLTMNLPEGIQTETKVSNIANLVFYDIQDMSNFRSHNPTAGYFGKTTLQVLKNGKPIGNMTLGNSVRVTYNLTNQSTLTMGDEGYIISWVYLDEAASMKGTEETKNTIRRDGTKTIEAENTVVYDLDYKPGWNLVKTEVIGKYDLEHERGLNASWFKKHEHTVIENTPSDAAYFFRKQTY